MYCDKITVFKLDRQQCCDIRCYVHLLCAFTFISLHALTKSNYLRSEKLLDLRLKKAISSARYKLLSTDAEGFHRW